MIFICVALMAGCATETGQTTKSRDVEKFVNKPTITQEQALDRIEQIIKETVKAIEPKPKLELYRPSLNVNMCVDPTDGGSENRVIVARAYYLNGITQDQVGNVARQVRQHWEQQGHQITVVTPDGLDISGRSRPDDFILSLTPTGDANAPILNLGVTSPCIWPNGTPEPSTDTGMP